MLSNKYQKKKISELVLLRPSSQDIHEIYDDTLSNPENVQTLKTK